MTAPNDAGAGNAGESAGQTTPPAGGAPAQQFAPITSQADLDRVIGERLNRQRAQFGDYDTLKTKAAKLDEIEAKSKSELERATDAAKAHEARASAAETALMRHQVAAAKGIPAELADRLNGKTKEEMEADADKLLGVIKPQGAAPGGDPLRPVTTLRSGALPAGAPAGGGSANDWMRAQASR
jgi:hypothetical protein